MGANQVAAERQAAAAAMATFAQEHPTEFGKRIAKATVEQFNSSAGEQLRSRLSRTVLASVTMTRGAGRDSNMAVLALNLTLT